MVYGQKDPVVANTAAGNNNIDALLTQNRWASPNLSFSFTDNFWNDYEDELGYANSFTHGSTFTPLNSVQQSAVYDWMNMYQNVSNLSFTDLTYANDYDATIRLGNSEHPGIDGAYAYAYIPHNGFAAGDVWFDSTTESNPVSGNRAYRTVGHEIGHALGLNHGHEPGITGVPMNFDRDSMEFSIMTYKSYVGDTNPGYHNEEFGHAQSLMMYDIAAIQHMYGANFAHNATDTVYQFSTNTGEMFINGVGQGQSGDNRIFRTIWDGSGNDTYDFSNYTTNLNVNLTPGSWSDLDANGVAQLAYLGDGNYARGHIFNALQFQGDTRSLIENAVGGSGNDTLIGNSTENVLVGNDGDDALYGLEGSDTLYGNGGNDSLDGGFGNDFLLGGTGNDTYHVDSMGDRVIEALGEGLDQVLASTSHILSANVEDLILQGTALSGQGNSLNNVISGNDASNYIDAGDGDDFVFGNGGNDTLSGGSGNDLMFGGEGSDIYYVDSAGDRITEGIDQGLDQVYASVNHTLDANVENLTLQGNAVDGFGNGLNNTINGTSLNNYLFGGGGDDFLYGDGGDDYINGGLGDDFMLGGVGNDEYVVDSAGDFVVENSGQGLDQVYSYIDYVLGANVENLTLEETSTAVTGQGNSLDNVVNGNGFDNTLYGHEGNDSLYGYEGNDGLSGGTGDDYLLGGAGSDYLLAGDGNDTLLGGVGNDSLEGGLGADKFFFGSLGEGIDNIIDFTQDQSDKLLISASGFGSDLMAGLLDSSQFVLGSSATGANERFIYDQGTGALSFDADGSGSQAAVQFASFSPSTALSHNDFLMV